MKTCAVYFRSTRPVKGKRLAVPFAIENELVIGIRPEIIKRASLGGKDHTCRFKVWLAAIHSLEAMIKLILLICRISHLRIVAAVAPDIHLLFHVII